MAKKWTLSGCAALCILLSACGGPRRVDPFDTVGSSQPAPWELVDTAASTSAVSASASGNVNDNVSDSVPDIARDIVRDSVAGNTRNTDLSRYNRIGRLHEVFNDSNKYQYAAGERIGISPIRNLAGAYYTSRPLVRIAACQWYDMDTLTHSMPYLVPEAARLLETIGRNFTDSLKSRKLKGYKFRVTSVLRTSHSVKRLRRINKNATDSSTHQLGTTFDISYAKFNHDGSSPRISDEQLKYILAEVLLDLRKQNKCLVKFERKSPCFHITATGK